MDKINKWIFDLEIKIKNKPARHILALYILLIVSIIL